MQINLRLNTCKLDRSGTRKSIGGDGDNNMWQGGQQHPLMDVR